MSNIRVTIFEFFKPLWCVLLFVSASGCSDNIIGPGELNEAGFPLHVGNHWTYHVAAERQAAVSGKVGPPESWTTQVVWEVEAHEEVLGVMAYRIKTTFNYLSGPDSGRTVSGRTWFAQGDTLKSVAFDEAGIFSPETAVLHKSGESTSDDPSPWEVNVLVFPLKVGKTWDFGAGTLTSDKKTVESIDNLSVPAGKFKAFRVVRRGQSSSFQIVTKQWFTSVGVVKMVDEQNLTERDFDENGNPVVITTRLTASMVLDSYDIE